ncbi:thioredoxin (plasmid) [Lactococcus lactis subsp. lactis]|uniref:thioredoxin n=1 Tax=Lactococcus TaxID=1357 RepID=UPI002078829B|nr:MULTISPECIES: thioredoxin [Lactococcus]USI64387.1 thioredoxin [Lactococcus lactis subsp. lactis]
MIQKIIKGSIVIALTGFLLLGLNFYRTEHSQVPIKSIDKDKIQLFYRDDCPDCKKIFKQIYLHNLIKQDIQFINLKPINNRHYIDEYNIHTVPTFIHKNKAYAGTNTAHLNKFLTGE